MRMISQPPNLASQFHSYHKGSQLMNNLLLPGQRLMPLPLGGKFSSNPFPLRHLSILPRPRSDSGWNLAIQKEILSFLASTLTLLSILPSTPGRLQAGRSRGGAVLSLLLTPSGASLNRPSWSHRGLTKPVIQYGTPVWFPNAARSSITKLQVVQNSALRVVTCCHRMALVNHLHQEAFTLPLSLLSKQHLASSLVGGHQSHHTVTANSRLQKSKRLPISFLLASGGIFMMDYLQHLARKTPLRPCISTLRQATFQPWIQIKSLGYTPHPLFLKRNPTAPLWHSFVRGYCIALNQHTAQVSLSLISTCSKCGLESHTIPQPFNCPSFCTELTPADLWASQRQSALFIASLPVFSYLPPLPRPLSAAGHAEKWRRN